MTYLFLALSLVTADVVARVNGSAVTADDVAARVAAARAAGSRQDTAALVEDLVNEAVLADEGTRLGLDREARVREAGTEAARRAAAGVLLEQGAAGMAPPTDAELLELYHGSADSVRLQEIVVATREEAQGILDRLAGGAKLVDEAKRSLDGRGGDRGLQVRAQLEPALAELAFGAPLGVPSGPVELSLGWAVIVPSERTVGDPAAFARRRPEILRYAQKQQAAAMKNHLITQLRKAAGVTLDEAFLAASAARVDATPADLDHVVANAGKTPVRYRQVLERLRGLSAGRQGGHFSGPSVKGEIAWAVIDQILLEDAAVARGLDGSPAAVAARRHAEREAMVRLAADRLRQAVPAPSPDEIAGWYRQHLAELVRPARRVCMHILVANKGVAETLRARLASGAMRWDQAAAEHSLDAATANAGGVVGTLDDRQLDTLAAAGEPGLAGAWKVGAAGTVAGPVHSRAGWHLVRTSGLEAATVPKLEDVSERISARLLAERRDGAVRARLASLRASARVEIDSGAVKRLDSQLTTRKEPTP